MSTRRIVVDVSDLVRWQGNLSGIQRVVAEMAYRYEAIGAVFCYYLEDERRFYALDSFSDFMADRTAPAEAPATQAGVTRTRRRLKKAAHLATPPVVWSVRRRLSIGVTEPANHHDGKDFVFLDKDILLIFGAHWDKPHYTEVLAEEKKAHGLFIGHLINDLIPVFDSAHTAEVEHTRFPKYMREISLLSDLIYLESRSTARDYDKFVEQQGISNEKPATRLVTLGENIKNTKSTKPVDFSHKSFILSVGTMEVRKNHILLYMVYKRAYELGIDLPQLVIVGRKGWLADDVYYQLVHDTDIKDKVTIIHGANDENLAWFYKNCRFVVFPSHYEGWGLPVAEAAHYGKVTAASNKSSIPEVVGDAAVYFSPYSVEECLDALQALSDDKTLSKYEAKLQKRTPNTWDGTFQQTFKDIEPLLK